MSVRTLLVQRPGAEWWAEFPSPPSVGDVIRLNNDAYRVTKRIWVLYDGGGLSLMAPPEHTWYPTLILEGVLP